MVEYFDSRGANATFETKETPMLRRDFLKLSASTVLFAASSALVGCGESASDATVATVDAGMKFVVGFDSAYPPYGYIADDGSYTGFDLDLAQAVCKRNDWVYSAEPIDWDAKDALINQGTITCIWNGFTQEGREDDYTFSKPYMLNEQVVVVKADSGIDTLEGLAGKTVITQVDSAALDVLEGDKADVAQSFAGGTVQTIADYNSAFMQLESGLVDAVACDLSIAQYQMSANPGVYVMISEPLSEEHYAVGFKKGDTELADAVTEALIALYEDGTVKELCEKYADYGLDYNNWILK
jgi:polar amino acid transport system substrate-binding protein